MTCVQTLYSGLIYLFLGLKECIAGDVCIDEGEAIYCSSGCCGSYRDHHCCSHTGLIVGIVVCVAVITGIVVIYCYLKHRNRKRTHAQFLRPVVHGQPVPLVNNINRGPSTIAGPALPGYPPPYEYCYNQPPIQPKGPPPAYDVVYRTAAGIGSSPSNNNGGYPPTVS
ncbi:uncharacterized protein LOC127698567 [Mytilus californianus]|uniref:uncharacterized protein LOC127698567 n=1 Tax=Mytilus californianus TaxID=6549 RepID=UPI0022478F55|nr:uncharacterized protein LOC127698567 [Mytilus californianus]